ncbi:MAG: carbohydrate kinase [Candidatus Glassbacteria bacterium]|nr:carbohydrate kinase [Candidatus Glassbacteria bacterium]
MPHKILSFGEILWDLLPDGPVLGGAPFNLAYRLAELGEHALIASRVGDDDLGSSALIAAQKLGVDTSLVQSDPDRPTGTVEVKLSGGEPEFRIVSGVAFDWIELTAGLDDAAAGADCICFGSLSQRAEISRKTIQTLLYCHLKVLTFCDINLRRDCYSADTVEDSLLRADIFKLNETEVPEVSAILFDEQLSPQTFARQVLEQFNPRTVLVTLGERGVLAVTGNTDPVYVPGYRVQVVDTVGSGDAFSAGFLHRFLAGDTLAGSCDFGCRLGALVSARKGGTAAVEQQALESFGKEEEKIADPRFREYGV